MPTTNLKLFFLVIFFPLATFAGNENLPVGARSAALNHTSVNLQDIWSTHHNQAGLASLTNIGGGIYYESRFTMKELSLKGGAVALPLKFGTFGLSVSSFGYSLYSESKVGLAYAMKLSEFFRAGVQLNYHNTHFGEGYGNINSFTAEVGIQADITEHLSMGAHVFNVSFTKMTDYNNERIPTILRIGAQYQVGEKAIVAAEVDKNIYDKASFKAGIEYHVTEILYLRGGVGTEPTLASFGFGLKFNHFVVDLASGYHANLGFSPQISLSYNPF
jgi:hypothetical protein